MGGEGGYSDDGEWHGTSRDMALRGNGEEGIRREDWKSGGTEWKRTGNTRRGGEEGLSESLIARITRIPQNGRNGGRR